MAENGKIEEYHYPSNIKSSEFEYRKVIFMALTGKGTNSTLERNLKDVEKANEGNVIGMITLPLTSNINDSQDHSWQSTDYYSVLTGGVKAASGALENKPSGGILGDVSKVISTVKETMEGPGFGALADLMGTRRPLLNPGYFQYYTGSNLRSFDFSFDFIPENEAETQQVIDIILAFKKFSSPSRPFNKAASDLNPERKGDFTMGNWLMMSPCTWLVIVYNEKIFKLLSFHDCVCTRVSVTYGDSDKVAMFNDGMPKQITLNLNFSESSLQFAESYGGVPSYLTDATENTVQAIDNALQTVKGAYDEASKYASNAAKAAENVITKIYNFLPDLLK